MASDPLRVAGRVMVDARGVRYVPYGISVIGLEQWDGLTARVERDVEHEIQAATTAWHSNTVRLQVAAWLSQQQPVAFWSELDREVLQVTCQRDIVVLNDNPLFTTHEHGPTQLDLGFVQQLAARYRALPNVIIDPFNEPHLGGPRDGISRRQMWQMWLRGGTVHGRRFLGMQAMVDAIRATGNTNLVWVEPPEWAAAVDRIDRYRVRGRNLVVEFHHPKLRRPWTWTQMLRPTREPRVEGEESQYASPWRPECDGSAYRALPRLLRALVRYGDGLLSWTLEPGVLVAAPRRSPAPADTIPPWFPASEAALTRPTVMRPDYSCHALGQGMGELALQVLRRYAAASDPYAWRYQRLARGGYTGAAVSSSLSGIVSHSSPPGVVR